MLVKSTKKHCISLVKGKYCFIHAIANKTTTKHKKNKQQFRCDEVAPCYIIEDNFYLLQASKVPEHESQCIDDLSAAIDVEICVTLQIFIHVIIDV